MAGSTLGPASGSTSSKVTAGLTTLNSHLGPSSGSTSSKITAGLTSIGGLLRGASGQSSSIVSAGLTAVYAGTVPRTPIVHSPQAHPVIR